MQVIDPGHQYYLDVLDGVAKVLLTFVKREGEGYPGNVGSHSGTTLQEVLRACIDRVKYLDNQIPHHTNKRVLEHLRLAIWGLEYRAAERHDRILSIININEIEKLLVCPKCLHIGCEGRCRDANNSI